MSESAQPAFGDSRSEPEALPRAEAGANTNAGRQPTSVPARWQAPAAESLADVFPGLRVTSLAAGTDTAAAPIPSSKPRADVGNFMARHSPATTATRLRQKPALCKREAFSLRE